MDRYDVCWVCFPFRDGLEPLHGELAKARRRFFESGRRTVKVEGPQTISGFQGHVKGKLTRRSFFWKKTVKGVYGGSSVLEEAFGQRQGWLAVTRDFRGIIVSRVFFDREHRWTKSEYYEPWDAGRARVIFQPGEEPGTVERRDWDAEAGSYRGCLLYTAPYRSGTAEQSLVDARFGQPQLVLATTKGELCCCPKAEAEGRTKAMEDVRGGTMVLMPAWEVKDGALLDEEDQEEGSTITFTSLEEYAKIQPAASNAAEPKHLKPGASLPSPLTLAQPAEAEFTPEAGEDPASPVPEEPAGEPAPVEEVEAPGAEPETPAEPSQEAQGSGAAVLTADGAQAPDGLRQPTLSPPADDGQEDAENLEAILAEAAALGEISLQPETPDLSIPAGYAGDIREGKVTGRGRAQQNNGMTSYEGEYLDSKRHGFGTYYYKDGNLCYAGGWKEDRRDGLGVSFRDSDHALHVATWQDGKPQGLVTLFDKDGNLRYSGRMEDGKKEGAGVMIDGKDGTVFVGQFSGGEATGLGSAFDQDGRLLYYGGWKDGRRHGQGTEFDRNGVVIFDGEFRDGKYYNGVLYQKMQTE